jgi:hypothetical protein
MSQPARNPNQVTGDDNSVVVETIKNENRLNATGSPCSLLPLNRNDTSNEEEGYVYISSSHKSVNLTYPKHVANPQEL